MSPFLKNLKIVTYTTRFLIRFTAWTKLAQAKVWVSHCIFNYSHHVYNSTFFVFSSANIQHCINNIGPRYFTVAPMWPKSYRTIGPKSTFLRHLVSHRTLSKTLIHKKHLDTVTHIRVQCNTLTAPVNISNISVPRLHQSTALP